MTPMHSSFRSFPRSSPLLGIDTSTLGGAGFASQSYTFGEDSPLSYPSSKYAGLALTLLLPPTSDSEKGGHQSTSTTISPRLPTTLTITFKTEEAERRPDGRMESGINWEAHVDTRDLSATTTIANASEEVRYLAVIRYLAGLKPTSLLI